MLTIFNAVMLAVINGGSVDAVVGSPLHAGVVRAHLRVCSAAGKMGGADDPRVAAAQKALEEARAMRDTNPEDVYYQEAYMAAANALQDAKLKQQRTRADKAAGGKKGGADDPRVAAALEALLAACDAYDEVRAGVGTSSQVPGLLLGRIQLLSEQYNNIMPRMWAALRCPSISLLRSRSTLMNALEDAASRIYMSPPEDLRTLRTRFDRRVDEASS